MHEADLDDDRFDVPEASGLDTLVRGLALVYDDDELLVVKWPVFEGLYAYFRRGATAVDP